MARSAAQARAQHAWYKDQQARQSLGDLVERTATYDGRCSHCGGAIKAGQRISWNTIHRLASHLDCANPAGAVVIPLDVPVAPVATTKRTICRDCGAEQSGSNAAEECPTPSREDKRFHYWKTVRAE